MDTTWRCTRVTDQRQVLTFAQGTTLWQFLIPGEETLLFDAWRTNALGHVSLDIPTWLHHNASPTWLRTHRYDGPGLMTTITAPEEP